MRKPSIRPAAGLLLLVLGCAATQRTSSWKPSRTDRLVEVAPVRAQSPWRTPTDLEKYPGVLALYVDPAPAVDGEFSDWPSADWIEVADREHYGGRDWKGPDDCSFRVAFAYDAANLYVAAEATDDLFRQPFAGEDIWKGDSFQLGLDPRLDRSERAYADDDTELGWAALPAGDGGAVWRWTAPRGLSSGPFDAPLALKHEGPVTRYELALPLDRLGQLSPGLIDRCGISFMYNDNDTGPDREREGFMQWTPSIAETKDPSSFGILIFQPPPEDVFPGVAARLRPIKTVSERGSTLEFRLDLVARRGAPDGLLTVVFDDGTEALILTKKTVPVLAGEKTYDIAVDTACFPEGPATLGVRFDVGDHSVGGDYAVYVYPPIRWSK